MNYLRKHWYAWLALLMWIAAMLIAWRQPGAPSSWAFLCTSWVLLSVPQITAAYRRYFPVKLPHAETPLEVLLIDPENERWYMRWGITEERAMELAMGLRGKEMTIEETLIAISKECKHPNELMYISFMLAVYSEQQRSSGIVHHIIRTAFGHG